MGADQRGAGISDDGSALPSRDFDLNKARDTAGGIVNGIIGAVKNPVDAGRKLAAAADRMHRELPIFITAREELKGISKTLMEKYDRVFDGSRADIDAWQQRVHLQRLSLMLWQHLHHKQGHRHNSYEYDDIS